ncbi:cytidine deaminase [Candidatus Woesearchaeota archaeon]|nr:MAG: cytidine deaminase [Candidatus Woesearchaeota archaeon]
MLNDDQIGLLLQSARAVQSRAVAPYSQYKVGAALMAATGRIYTGMNIENATYSAVHAENLALYVALMTGETEFLGLVVVTNDANMPYPCGSCRQELSHHCKPDFGIIGANLTQRREQKTLGELLPDLFGADNLKT